MKCSLALVAKLTDEPRVIELSLAKIDNAAGLKLASATEVVEVVAAAALAAGGVTFGAETGRALGAGLAVGLETTGATTLGGFRIDGAAGWWGEKKTTLGGAFAAVLVGAGTGLDTGLAGAFVIGATTGAVFGFAGVIVVLTITVFAQTVTAFELVVEP